MRRPPAWILNDEHLPAAVTTFRFVFPFSFKLGRQDEERRDNGLNWVDGVGVSEEESIGESSRKYDMYLC